MKFIHFIFLVLFVIFSNLANAEDSSNKNNKLGEVSGEIRFYYIFDPSYSFFSRNTYRANVDAYKLGVNLALSKNFKIIASHADYVRSTTDGTFVPAKPIETPTQTSGDAIESALLFSYNSIQSTNILSGAIYKTSEYSYENKQVELLDLDLVVTYNF